MSSVVEMTGVVKRFGAVTALDGLDFDVAAGEVHGFLGPNGSGKSTTLRLLLGLLRSNAGLHPGARAGPVARRGDACTAGWPTSPGTWPCGPT